MPLIPPRLHTDLPSSLNRVDRILGDTTKKRVRHGVFTSLPQRTAAIHEYVAGHKENPEPFV